MLRHLNYILNIAVLSILLFSCNDAGNETEEHEETEAPKTETKPEIKQDVEQPKTDIKQDINKEKKFKSRQFTIQIGAFSNETNAKDFLEKAGKLLSFDVTYIFAQGLYKVRTGVFSSITEAISNIEQIVLAGFKDPFIIEINK